MMCDFRQVDARVGLASLPDGSVDMIFTDPPYPVISGGNKTEYKGKDGRKQRATGMLSKNDGKIFKHNDIAPEEYAAELFRVLRDPGHCYVMTNELNRRRIEDALLDAGFRTHQLLTWKKNNTSPNRFYMKNQEYVFFVRKGPAFTINNPGSKACHDFKNPVGKKSHLTEKPVDLIRFYIENSSQPGDVILDPFAGSGAAGVAALEAGRRFVGFEIDEEYFIPALFRLEQSGLTVDTLISGDVFE